MFTALSLGSALFLSGISVVSAQSMMHGSMMMPHCASGDPVVMVNMKDKMFSMADKSHMMHGTMDKSMMMKNHMSMMCKSKAVAMGGHMMMKGSMQH